MIDLHSHTFRCRHAVGSMQAYVERAISEGITHFGFSDHSPWMLHAKDECYAMQPDELAQYVADVRQLQAQYNCDGTSGEREFHLWLGMEMDFIPSRLDIARQAIQAYEWDYLLGSIHNIGFEKLQRPEMYDCWEIDDVCELYFEQLHMMVKARFCDIIAHLDLPKKMGQRPSRGMLHYIEPLIADIKAAGMAVEINTPGLANPADECMPGFDVAGALNEAGIPLTIGCDSHAPEQVGRYIMQTLEGLQKVGVRELVRFERRKPVLMPIAAFS